jgi:hypothetical protein
MHAFDFVPLGVYLPSLASCLLAADRQQHFFLAGCGLAPWNLRFRLRNKWLWFLSRERDANEPVIPAIY